MNGEPIGCVSFEGSVAELAAGLVPEPDRSALLAHADRCPRCQASLDDLAAVADTMLLLAPQVEPPAGFESQVLARLGHPVAAPARRRRWFAAVAAAVALLAGAGAGEVVARASDRSRAGAVAGEGRLVTGDGVDVGLAQLLARPRPLVLVSVDRPRPGPGVRRCELVLPDGRSVVVGSWSYDEIATGIWAVGVGTEMLDAVTMRVLADDGSVLASAELR